jgi:hypothetical protein
MYWILVLVLIMNIITLPLVEKEVLGASNVNLIVDGKDITDLSEPIIVNNRTLVPIRFVFEEIGGEVEWNGEDRSVTAKRGNSQILLKIGSYIVDYNEGRNYELSDVAPEINNLGNGDRTYVPLRLISNALGVGIEWDENTRTVNIDSSKSSSIEKFHDLKITSHEDGDVIEGEEKISIDIPDNLKGSENEIRLLLIDKDSRKGSIIDRGTTERKIFTYIPKMSHSGNKLLIAAVYKNDEFLAGDVVEVGIEIEPEIKLEGVKDGETYTTSIDLKNNINFFPKYVRYQLEDLETGKIILSGEQDPYGDYSWTPTYENNGTYNVKVIAYDENDNPFESEGIEIKFDLKRKLKLAGVSKEAKIDGPITLIADRNFNVNETHYLIRDKGSHKERILKTQPYGGYTWFPEPEDAGEYELMVRVEDTRGVLHDSPWIPVTVSGTPKIFLKGVGPDEVVTEERELSVNTNVELDSLKFVLTDKESGLKRVIIDDLDVETKSIFKPFGTDEGKMTIRAEAAYNGEILTTEEVDFNVYLGEIHSSKPIVEKDKFLDFASDLAVKSQKETGMSAALQTAQAVLETGWGQYVPVDKYTGKFSYNLFGIKGEGTNGSIISNTWEVYNGVSYRVDDYFRAYKNVNEAWQDHKNILLNLDRYEGFRNVMFDSTKGAWAVKRAGYATDPQYPMKLMNIIDSYDLYKLDEVEL